MSNVLIQKFPGMEVSTSPQLMEIEKLFDQIKQQAFHLSCQRVCQGSHELDDWLTAERHVLWIPLAELVEKINQFEVRIGAPGLEPKDIQVLALPEAIIVRGDASHAEASVESEVRFSEFRERTLYRRIDLPGPIDVDRVTATLHQGTLVLTAAKAAKRKEQSISAGA